jgi:hypothetical protein
MMFEQVQPKKADKIFPFMEELNEDNMDVYDENFIEASGDNDMMTAEEEGFMLGYLEA